jgi:hypothetical protein
MNIDGRDSLEHIGVLVACKGYIHEEPLKRTGRNEDI